jgi:hypothetical protein
MIKKSFSILLVFCPYISLIAQQADRQTTSAGGSFFVLSTNVSFQTTVGEAVSETLKTESLMLTQGFEQPEQVLGLPINVPTDVVIYPNPTTDQIKIRFNLKYSSYVAFALINNAGQIVYQSEQWFPAGLQEIPFNFKAAPGLYLISMGVYDRFITYKVIIN